MRIEDALGVARFLPEQPDLGCTTTRSHSLPCHSPRPWSPRQTHGLGASLPCACCPTPSIAFSRHVVPIKTGGPVSPPLSVSSCSWWWPTSSRWLAASESEVVVSGGKLDQRRGRLGSAATSGAPETQPVPTTSSPRVTRIIFF